jgi:hypothetical protein
VPYYERDLAFIHDRGYGLHGDRCAPGILGLLAPVRGGLVLELGCGSGALTRHLLAAGLRVVATDAGHGVQASVGTSFGDAELPAGQLTSVGHPPSSNSAAAGLDDCVTAHPPEGVCGHAILERRETRSRDLR